MVIKIIITIIIIHTLSSLLKLGEGIDRIGQLLHVSSREALYDLAVLNEDECGHRHDTEALSYVCCLVDIHLVRQYSACNTFSQCMDVSAVHQ